LVNLGKDRGVVRLNRKNAGVIFQKTIVVHKQTVETGRVALKKCFGGPLLVLQNLTGKGLRGNRQIPVGRRRWWGTSFRIARIKYGNTVEKENWLTFHVKAETCGSGKKRGSPGFFEKKNDEQNYCT